MYTANILTAKTTGFTCVSFSPVLPLSFWQAMKAGSEPLYFSCTQKSHCLFGYISEPKIQLLPAKDTKFTYEKSNFFFLFLIPHFIEKHVYCINENRKFGENFEKNIFQKFLFSIKMQPIMAKKAN